eukprot:697352-Prorocentrum_minimum.AAC.1
MDGKLLVDLAYLRTLVAMANDKFRANTSRIQRFYDLFATRFPPGGSSLDASSLDHPHLARRVSIDDDGRAYFTTVGSTVKATIDGARREAAPAVGAGVAGRRIQPQDRGAGAATSTTPTAPNESNGGGWVLMVQQSKAKPCKDALKDLLWTDFRRKPNVVADQVGFPVSPEAAAVMLSLQQQSEGGGGGEGDTNHVGTDAKHDGEGPKEECEDTSKHSSVHRRRKFQKSQRSGPAHVRGSVPSR